MDDDLLQRARSRGGLVLPAEVGGLRAAHRRGLTVIQPGVLVASTQPVDAETLVRAVELSVDGEHWFAGRTALWSYGAGAAPDVVDVAVRDARQLVLGDRVRVRRLAQSLLRSTRTLDGRPVVALETAVVQSAESPEVDVLVVVEDVLRRRLTTHPRLLQTCRRGVAGSAALRSALEVVADGDLEKLKRQLRSALVAAGVRDLESEVAVRSTRGAVVYLDLLHRPSRNAFEVDGWSSHSERGRFLADRRRDRWVRREHGITTSRVAADECRTDLAGVVAELLDLLGLPRTDRRPA